MTGNDGQSSADQRTALAENRTEWAEDRTALANERTFAAWARTALASAALGLGFNALVRSFDPQWLAKIGATLFLLISVGILFFAAINARSISERLAAHSIRPLGKTRTNLVAASLAVACCAVILIIWLID